MKFEVWNEGYLATGDEAPAWFLGTYEAETFKDAVDLAAAKHGFDLDSHSNRPYPNEPTFYACRFFDNEKDARKSYG